jgi:hypothetical protein
LPGEDEDSAEWCKRHIAAMNETNPCIANFIASFALECPETSRMGVLMSSILVYRLLESQAEADRMTEEIKLV